MRLQVRIVCHGGCEGCVAAAGGLISISQLFARLSRMHVYQLSAGKACCLDAAKLERICHAQVKTWRLVTCARCLLSRFGWGGRRSGRGVDEEWVKVLLVDPVVVVNAALVAQTSHEAELQC